MDDITNAQLMNAIKLLTQKVEALEEAVAGSQRGRKPSVSPTLPSEWKYDTITQEIVNAVLSFPGIREAADTLQIPEKELSALLKESGIPHLYGERWSVAIKRAISGEETVDKFTYPEKWFEKKEKIKAHAEKYGLKETAKKLDCNFTIVGRFIQTQC
jgi:hypothetical protein